MNKHGGPRSKIKGVFFDLYGTLLIYGDMNAAWSGWLDGFYMEFRARGLDMDKQMFAEACDGFFGREVDTSAGDGLTLFERRIDLLAGEQGIQFSTSDLRRLADTLAEEWQKHISLDPQAIPLLMELRRYYYLALVSNYDHPPYLRQCLTDLKLDGLFDAVVISAEVGVEKPDPRIFEEPLKRGSLQPDQVVFVGDMDIDVEGAKASGIAPILIRRVTGDGGAAAMDYRADGEPDGNMSSIAVDDGVITISSLTELPGIVETL